MGSSGMCDRMGASHWMSCWSACEHRGGAAGATSVVRLLAVPGSRSDAYGQAPCGLGFVDYMHHRAVLATLTSQTPPRKEKNSARLA